MFPPAEGTRVSKYRPRWNSIVSSRIDEILFVVFIGLSILNRDKVLEGSNNIAVNTDAGRNVRRLGQHGRFVNRDKGDSNGRIYQLIPDHNAIFAYGSSSGRQIPLVRDPCNLWLGSALVGEDGYSNWTFINLLIHLDLSAFIRERNWVF